jgi:predicted metalloprotease
MNWRNFNKSGNVEDRRGGGGLARAGGLSLGTIAIAVVGGLIFGVNPLQILGLLGSGGGYTTQGNVDTSSPAMQRDLEFVQSVLGDTERVWGEIFAKGGSQYTPPKLVLFSGATSSGCGAAQSAMGPFYCPSDQRVYLDTGFYQELQGTSQNDFAKAYVIAHEVGHHVQNLLGISEKADAQAARAGSQAAANAISVRVELQADCFAGIWAKSGAALSNASQADIAAALETAREIGDDTLQRASRGVVVPDSFTHGTSAQRQRWFATGFQTGDIAQCNTFAAKTL